MRSPHFDFIDKSIVGYLNGGSDPAKLARDFLARYRAFSFEGKRQFVVTRAVARPPLTHIGIGVIDTVLSIPPITVMLLNRIE